jgi:hypothetical protein
MDPDDPTDQWMMKKAGELVSEVRKLRGEWQQKVVLSVAVGNGAGLVVLGGALINSWKLNLWFEILPALWIFAIGLILAGIAPFFIHRAYEKGNIGLLALDAHQNGVRPEWKKGGKSDPEDVAFKNIEGADKWEDTSIFISALSGVAFSFGIIWPIFTITFRLG